MTITNPITSFQIFEDKETGEIHAIFTLMGEDGQRATVKYENADDLAAIMDLYKESAIDLYEGQKYGFKYLTDKYGPATELELDPNDFA